MKRINILCVDDHTVVRKGLTGVLEEEPDMKVVAYASTGADAVTQYLKHRPDVTLMDLQLPGMSGFDAIRAIREEDPDAQIIVLTMYRGEADVARALKAGAADYVLKDAPASDLIDAIRSVHAGDRPLDTAAKTHTPEAVEVTEREEQVLQLLAKGMRNKEIGAALNISATTVHSHVKNIFAKLNVHDRTEALTVAIRRGIIHID